MLKFIKIALEIRFALFSVLCLMVVCFSQNVFAQGSPQAIVRVVYFLPNDRGPQPDMDAKLDTLIKQVKRFYADELHRHGYGRKPFRLETDTSGTTIVHRLNGKFNDAYYQHQTSKKVHAEVVEVFGLENINFVVMETGAGFLESDAADHLTTCGIGGAHSISGGMTLMPASGECFQGESGFKIAVHELGHAFGLFHDFRDDAYVMSYGQFRNKFSVSAAHWLSVHPHFSPQPTSGNRPATIQVLPPKASPPDSVAFRFTVSDVEGIHQIQLLTPATAIHDRLGDPHLMGYETYTAERGDVTFQPTVPFGNFGTEFLVQVMDVRGNFTRESFVIDTTPYLLPAATVSIPDPHLATAVRTALNLPQGERITHLDMLNLIEFWGSRGPINDLTGLEHAKNLKRFSQFGGQLSDLTPLASLTELRYLALVGCQVGDITPLRALTKLTWLDLYENQIRDLTPLADLTKLEILQIYENQIRDLTPLKKMTELRSLALETNQIRDITPLTGLTQLKVLLLSENQITDVRPLVALTQLETLRLTGNPFLSLAPLRTLLQRNPQLELDVDTTQSPPIVLFGTPVSPQMYWIDAKHGTLHRLRGRTVENLLPGVRNATSLAVDGGGGKLYWMEQTGPRSGRIRSARLDGTPNIEVVKELTSRPIDMALDAAGRKIYLTNSWGKVQRLNVDGTDFQPNLITGLKSPRAIALDLENGKVYWTEHANSIRRADLDGSTVETLATGVANPTSLLIADAKLYWTTQPTQWKGHIHCADLNGFDIRRLASVPGSPQGLVVETTQQKLYWANTLGGLQRSDLNGKNIQNLLTRAGSPRTLAFDGRWVSVDIAEFIDFNQDGRVDQTDYLIVVNAQGEDVKTHPHADLNQDGQIDVDDLLIVIEHFDEPINPAAPALGDLPSTLTRKRLQATLHILRTQSDGSLKYQRAIALLEDLLVARIPEGTMLLANYPNPFNPETWIPYQLATPVAVNISICAADGRLVQRLALGHQPAGMYHSRSRAAYWDGRNVVGECVASGVYFYTITAGDFTATRKLLIRK